MSSKKKEHSLSTFNKHKLKKGGHMHGETVPPSIIYFTFNLKRAKYKFAQVKKGSHTYNDIHQVTLPEGESRYYLQLKNEEIVPQVTTWLNWLMCRNVNEDGWPLHGNTHLAYMKLHKDYFN